MPTVVQFRRGTTAQNNNHVGAAGEISIDTTLNTLRVHNGTDSGGFTTVMETAAQTVSNKTLTDVVNISLVDQTPNGKVVFGDDKADIFMNDSNFFVRNNAGGYLYFGVKSGQHMEFVNQDTDNKYARFNDSDVVLYYNGSKKIQTVDSGVRFYGDLLPDADSTRSLGSPTNKWKDLYLSGSTLFLGGLTLKDSAGILKIEDSAGITQSFDLGANTTDNLNEGSSNLYYTTVRVDSDIASTLAGNITVGGNAIISGDLTVNGTTTTVNSTTLSINDLNIVLADSAQDSSQSDGAGITVNGSGASIIYTNATGTWDFNRPFGTTTNVLSNYTTDNLTEGSNLYFTDERVDDRVSALLVGGTNINVSYDDDGNALTISATIDSGVGFDLSENTTDDLTEGSSNLYYTRARFDSALGDATSTATIRSYFSATGDLSYDSNTGIFSFDVENVYTQANFDSDFNTSLDDAALGGTGLTFDSATNTLSITNTGVAAATYGSASLVPVLTINAQGQIDSAGTVSVAGVSTFDFDSATGQITIGTADGGTFAQVITLDPYTTTDLTEGTNLYYTRGRFDSALGDATSTATIRSYFSATGDLSYDSNTGAFSFDVENVYTKVNFDSDLGLALDTDAVTTTDLTEGTNLYYTTARADSDAKHAISVTDAGGDGSLTYSSDTGTITYTGPSASEVRAHFSGGSGITIASGVIGVDSSSSPTVNSLTNTTGSTITTPTQTLASSDATVIVDTVAHGSDFKSIEYVVHLDDSDNGHSQMSKVLVTYNKSNVFYTEYGMVNSYTGDSDIGTLSADVSGGDIRLKFTRTAGIGTVAVKPVKTIIS